MASEMEVGEIVLALVVGVLFLTIVFHGNIQGAIGNTTETKHILTIINNTGAITPNQNADNSFTYTVATESIMRFAPLPEGDNKISVVSFITFKDAFASGPVFLVGSNDRTIDFVGSFIINSVEPLSERGDVGERTFIKGNQYIITAPDQSVFRISLLDATYKGLAPVCKAKFVLECKDGLTDTSWLQACDDPAQPNQGCMEANQICHGTVTMLLESADCAGGSATAIVSTSGGEKWAEIGEHAVVSFFENTDCIKTIKDSGLLSSLDSLKQYCNKDFLASYSTELPYTGQ